MEQQICADIFLSTQLEKKESMEIRKSREAIWLCPSFYRWGGGRISLYPYDFDCWWSGRLAGRISDRRLRLVAIILHLTTGMNRTDRTLVRSSTLFTLWFSRFPSAIGIRIESIQDLTMMLNTNCNSVNDEVTVIIWLRSDFSDDFTA